MVLNSEPVTGMKILTSCVYLFNADPCDKLRVFMFGATCGYHIFLRYHNIFMALKTFDKLDVSVYFKVIQY